MRKIIQETNETVSAESVLVISDPLIGFVHSVYGKGIMTRLYYGGNSYRAVLKKDFGKGNCITTGLQPDTHKFLAAWLTHFLQGSDVTMFLFETEKELFDWFAKD